MRDTKHGVYIAKLGGGQVDTASGDFVFGMAEAYLIENGEIITCSREENSEKFWATIGGMGLTGIILTAKFKLKNKFLNNNVS